MTKNPAEYDVIIIGGGPGGLSAALWCADLGMSAVLLEKGAEVGGQLLRTFNAIKNHLGAEAANGKDLRDTFLKQVEKTTITRRTEVEVVKVDLAEKSIVLAGGEVLRGRSIIIATGVRRRTLGIPGEAEFYDKGILESGEKNKNAVSGKRVVIVGGGDAALENALILGRTAANVFVVHRRDKFSARSDFIRRAELLENVEFVFSSLVIAIIGNDKVSAVDVQDIATGTTLHIETDIVLIRIGEEPNTALFRGQIDLDDAGFVEVDNNCATSQAGVCAIGDAANPTTPTISSAVGQGATSVRSIFNFLKD